MNNIIKSLSYIYNPFTTPFMQTAIELILVSIITNARRYPFKKRFFIHQHKTCMTFNKFEWVGEKILEKTGYSE